MKGPGLPCMGRPVLPVTPIILVLLVLPALRPATSVEHQYIWLF